MISNVKKIYITCFLIIFTAFVLYNIWQKRQKEYNKSLHQYAETLR